MYYDAFDFQNQDNTSNRRLERYRKIGVLNVLNNWRALNIEFFNINTYISVPSLKQGLVFSGRRAAPDEYNRFNNPKFSIVGLGFTWDITSAQLERKKNYILSQNIQKQKEMIDRFMFKSFNLNYKTGSLYENNVNSSGAILCFWDVPNLSDFKPNLYTPQIG